MATVNDTPASTSNLVAILKFPQEGKTPRESYLPFFESVCDMAASKTASNQEFGLLGAVLTVAQYDIISPGVPFIILVNPGPLNPLAPLADRRLHAAWAPRDQAISNCSHPCALFGTNESASYSHGQSHNTLPEHFANHLAAHNTTAIANNSPFNERDKVAKLRNSLLTCGL